MKNALQPLEVKFINKFNLTKDDIFAEDIKRLAGTDEYDATTYINVKWFVLQGDTRLTLSVKLYPERTSGNIWFYTNQKDWDEYIQTQVTSDMFKTLLDNKQVSMNEDI